MHATLDADPEFSDGGLLTFCDIDESIQLHTIN